MGAESGDRGAAWVQTSGDQGVKKKKGKKRKEKKQEKESEIQPSEEKQQQLNQEWSLKKSGV